jgi:hypothetical protein
MRVYPLLLVVLSWLVGACGGASSSAASIGPPSTSTQQVEMLSYFVRAQGREQLLGTLAPDGTVTRNRELPTGDADADGATLSKALSVRLDADGRPLPPQAPAKADEPTITWALGEDGSVTWRVAPPASLASPSMTFQRGFRVLPNGSASLPTFGISY